MIGVIIVAAIIKSKNSNSNVNSTNNGSRVQGLCPWVLGPKIPKLLAMFHCLPLQGCELNGERELPEAKR